MHRAVEKGIGIRKRATAKADRGPDVRFPETASMMTAREIIAKLLIEIPKQFPARVWRRNVGAAVAGDRFIRFALPGEADITGIIAPGIRLEIEVKAGNDRLRDEQVSFLGMIEKHGGIVLVARDVEDTLAALRAALDAREVATR